jgi:hypothetical protein
MSRTKVRARKMWRQDSNGRIWEYADRGLSPVFVMEGTPEALAQIEEQIAQMIFVPLNAPKGDTNRIARSIMLNLGLPPAPPAQPESRRASKP